ncbi:UDP-perosamine 4-acetyltransferase [Cytobacillus eiseniae]|uniref:UDP-perosamine 4-acetyltransferase n=1 Tax=Cytobacillus eiseniae TaxID=762947 RepID=A0ABS4RHU5_9BACI|nr:acetyltransferase [Cytobacillus eiseniae]MBP2241991.1 UDP-perosamine 4-acetyltransferase [Cytobacillus eiseniae]
MANKPVILIGNGGHASVLTEILLQQNCPIIGFTAPENQENRFKIPYIGTDDVIDFYNQKDINLVLGLGSITVSTVRAKMFQLFKEKGYTFSSVIHQSAVISQYCMLGEGVQVMAGTVIEAFVEIADNTIINTSSSINHDCRIGKHCHIAPSTTLSGNVTVGDLTHIGTGSTVIQNVQIGSQVLIGAGSLVLRTIGDNSKAFGVPAKEV